MSAQLTRQGTRYTAIRTPEVGRLRAAWHRARQAGQEINYASHRVVEWQAPWIVDAQWHDK
jgi:hypothetical protein